MLKKTLKPLITVTGFSLLSACAITTPQKTQALKASNAFTPVRIAQNTASTKFKQVTDNIFVILDASSSKNTLYEGSNNTDSKFAAQKQFLNHFNATIPSNIPLSTGLRNFGFGGCTDWSNSKLFQGITPYNKANFKTQLSLADCASGGSPMESALEATENDLKNAAGNIALLIISDGYQIAASTLNKAKSLEEKFGDRLCIYSVWVGNKNEQAGQFFLQELSNIAQCGKNVTLNEVKSNTEIATFTEEILFNKTHSCPKKKIKKILDNDRDGVLNTQDACPNTPKGATVNTQGCWSIEGLTFDTNKSLIKNKYESLLNNAAYILNANANIHIRIEGHTDNRGSEQYNKNLSAQRAKSVKTYLINKGISAKRLSSQGFGERLPIASNDTDTGRKTNRRVVFTVLKH